MGEEEMLRVRHPQRQEDRASCGSVVDGLWELGQRQREHNGEDHDGDGDDGDEEDAEGDLVEVGKAEHDARDHRTPVGDLEQLRRRFGPNARATGSREAARCVWSRALC